MQDPTFEEQMRQARQAEQAAQGVQPGNEEVNQVPNKTSQTVPDATLPPAAGNDVVSPEEATAFVENEKAQLDEERGYHEQQWHGRTMYVVNHDPARTFFNELDAIQWVADTRGAAHMQARAAEFAANMRDGSQDDE